MKDITSLKQVVSFNEDFKTAVNLYLNLNNKDRISHYIPTKSSLAVLNEYLSSVESNKENATLLIGPYGKGKSHLLLVFLAIISLERNLEGEQVIQTLISKIDDVEGSDNELSKKIIKLWKRPPFLPVIIMDTQGDLNQAFLYGLNDALKREGLDNLIPDTYYSAALERISEWECNYPKTYSAFLELLSLESVNIDSLIADLKHFSKETLNLFKRLYPKVTSGSVFNPLATSEVLPLYQGINAKLCEDCGYSGMYVVFDEFSKFIESQNKKATGSNMKLLQDMCELANDSKDAQLFLTLVAHKSIKEYGKYLSTEVINSFTGIEGRIVEKYFITSSKNNYELIKSAIVKKIENLSAVPNYELMLGETAVEKYYQLPFFKSNFSKQDFENIIIKGCYPLNPISAYLLLNISEKVAQNERSLFTFISNNESNSMARYVSEHSQNQSWSICADLIYDYFSSLFKKDISNEFIHNEWLNAEHALANCKNEDQKKLLKILATILIANKDELPANEMFICAAYGSNEASGLLDDLENMKLVYKKASTGNFAFKTRAGSALKQEIKTRRALKGERTNYQNVFKNIMEKYYVIPKRYNSNTYMTRYFNHEYMHVDDFLNINDVDAFLGKDTLDGKVISLYSNSTIEKELVRKHVESLQSSKLVIVCPTAPFVMQREARDYEILDELKRDVAFIESNAVLKREISILEDDLSSVLKEHLKSIFEDETSVDMYFYTSEPNVLHGCNVEQVVNLCCEHTYSCTPLINNELINRHSINTSQTKKARKNIIRAILDKVVDEDFYSGTNQEATIYRALFVNTGLNNQKASQEMCHAIRAIDDFINSCIGEKQSFDGLLQVLTGSPFGMRLGVIPVYLADALAKRNEDLVVYFSNKEVTLNEDIILNICESPKDYELFISVADAEKQNYICNLNELFDVNNSRNMSDNRINNILICMQRWFRSLPQVTRSIVNLADYDIPEQTRSLMPMLRKELQKIDVNPYEILFVKLPVLCGSKAGYDEVFESIKLCKDAFDHHCDFMVERALLGTLKIFNGKNNDSLYHLLKGWYECQSAESKHGLHSNLITSFMSEIEKLNNYDDREIVRRVIKAISETYIENWNEASFNQYLGTLTTVKESIESIKAKTTEGKNKLSFVGINGNTIERYYESADEGTGAILRNILEDTLEEYDDLSVNDRVSILLEMIEKIIG